MRSRSQGFWTAQSPGSVLPSFLSSFLEGFGAS